MTSLDDGTVDPPRGSVDDDQESETLQDPAPTLHDGRLLAGGPPVVEVPPRPLPKTMSQGFCTG